MQGLLGNLFAGLTIILTKPFRIGEYIGIVDEEGTVETITLFQTTLSSSGPLEGRDPEPQDRRRDPAQLREDPSGRRHRRCRLRHGAQPGADRDPGSAAPERTRAAGHDASDRRAPARRLVRQYRGQTVGRRAGLWAGGRRDQQGILERSASTGSSFRIRSAKCGCYRTPPDRLRDGCMGQWR